jgi:photoactive yellow protein
LNFSNTPEIDSSLLDALPFGVILLDENGVILFYNRSEESSAGRDRREVVGRNFFTKIAPCAQVQDFYGQFLESVQKPGWIASFNFHYPLPNRARDVEIILASFVHEGDVLCLIMARDLVK